MLIQRITVPAFFVLGPDWQRLEQAGRAINIIVPEASIGLDAQLPAPVIEQYRDQFQRCRNNGQKILGYVSTRSGGRDRQAIDADIQSWFNRYPTQLDGIFFDEGPVFDNTTQQFYTTLINDFKTGRPANNTVLLNAAQFPNEWVMQVADSVILWEEKQSAYLNQYTAIGAGGSVVGVPAWWTNPQYINRIIHVVWNCPTAAEMRNIVALSQSRGAGNVYVYDGNSSAYNHLPAYWPEELAALAVGPGYGNKIKLRHFLSNRTLHSHPYNYGHPGTSGQQQVTAFEGADDNDFWIIKGNHGQPEDYRVGQPVRNGDIIRLEHLLTRRNLHSHGGFPSPVTEQQETTCFGENGVGDENDNWQVEVEGGGIWGTSQRLRLIHVNTNYALHSHQGFSHPEWTMGQQEVTCFPGRDDNDWWNLFEIQETVQLVNSTTLRGTYTLDFDTGVQGSDSGADVWWEQVNGVTRFLVPQSGATMAYLGQTNFDAVSLQTLQTQAYSASPVNGSDNASNQLAAGSVIAIRTGSGRYVKVRINSYGYNLGIDWVTYA